MTRRYKKYCKVLNVFGHWLNIWIWNNHLHNLLHTCLNVGMHGFECRNLILLGSFSRSVVVPSPGPLDTRRNVEKPSRNGNERKKKRCFSRAGGGGRHGGFLGHAGTPNHPKSCFRPSHRQPLPELLRGTNCGTTLHLTIRKHGVRSRLFPKLFMILNLQPFLACLKSCWHMLTHLKSSI